MKMTVKRGYLVQLRRVLLNANLCFEGTIPCKVRYAFSVNLKRCTDEAREIAEGFPPDEKWVEYEQGRRSILHEAGISSDDDLEKLSSEQRNALNTRIMVFREPYEEAIKAQNEIERTKQETLNEETEVELRTITPDELPTIAIKEEHVPLWNSVFKTTHLINTTDLEWLVWNTLFNDGNGIIRE